VLDREIVVPAPERDTPHLGHPPSPFGSVVKGHLFQQDDAVGDGMKLQIFRMEERSSSSSTVQLRLK